MNRVILMGRLTRDPEVRYSSGENSMAIARFTLAVDRRNRRDARDGESTADFIPCVSFGKQAEFAEKYLHQGMRMVVSGRIQTGSYTNREGQKVYTTEVILDDLEFAESKAVSEQNASRNSYQNQGQSFTPQSASTNTNSTQSADGFMNIPDGIDEELPFI